MDGFKVAVALILRNCEILKVLTGFALMLHGVDVK